MLTSILTPLRGALLLTLAFLPSLRADQYIVELTADAPQKARRLAVRRAQQAALRPLFERRGAKVTDELITTLNAFIIEADTTELYSIANTPGVARIYAVQDVYPATTVMDNAQRIQEAWSRIGGAARAGEGIKIAILDTGIDSTHPAFQDPSLTAPEGFPRTDSAANTRWLSSKVIVARSYERFNAGRAGFGSEARDINGHGTGSAMIAAGALHDSPAGPIAGAAPAAFLGNYRVLGDTNGGTTAGVIKAIDDAVADGMDVLNLSLGTAFASRPEEDAMVQALERAAAAGVVVIVAAGNAGPGLNSISSPGTAPSAITVGSHSVATGKTAWFSGRGPNLGAGLKPDLLAAGDQFYTADSSLRAGSSGYRTVAGTSLSTPVIAGMVAVLKSLRPGLTAADYKSLVINSTQEFEGRVVEVGSGRADLAQAVAATVTVEPAYLKGAGVHDVTVRNLMGEPQVCTASNGLSFTLDTVSTQQVTVSGEGWLTLTCDRSAPLRITYFAATPTTQISGITVLQAPRTAARGSVVEFGVRVTDPSGFAFTSLGAPRITVASGSAQVTKVTWMQGVPETFSVSVRVGAGDSVIRLAGGPASAEITISGQ